MKEREYNMWKFLLCIYIERLHRRCYDTLYFCKADYMRYKEHTIIDKILIKWTDFLSYKVMVDFRRYLRWYRDETTVLNYSRYTAYW